MYSLLPALFLFILCIFIFCREIKLDQKRFIKEHHLSNEHVLKEVEIFLKQEKLKGSIAIKNNNDG